MFPICFVIAVRNNILKNEPQILKIILEIINKQTKKFKIIPNIDQILSAKYKLKLTDVNDWLAITNWSQENLNQKTLDKIQNQLFDLKIIDKKLTFASIIKTI